MRVRFLSNFDFKPSSGCTIEYLEGKEYTVTTICGEKAIAVGKAVEIDKPTREEAKNGTSDDTRKGKTAKTA